MRIVNSLSKRQKFFVLLCFFSTIILPNLRILKAEAGLEKIQNKETLEIIRKAADYKNPYPSAVILLYDERYSVNKTNKVVFKKHVLTKVLTEGGKQFSTVALSFDSYFQKLKINVARTIQPNGDIVNIAPEAITEESPYESLPIYSDIKIKKMTFPAASVGSVMEYEVEYTMDYKDLPGFSVLFTVPLNWILLSARFSVEVPKETSVKFNAVRIVNSQPKILSSGGRDTYSWEENNVWVKGSEQPFLPAYMKFGPYISFSTIKSWEDVYMGCRKLMQGQAEPDKNIKAKVTELSQGIEKDRAKIIKRLYEYVSQNIQYVAIEWGLSAFKPYSAAEVFKNKYGDCKGKSALLISMLKSAGIKADYALVLTVNHGFIESEVPSVSFNHVIVAVFKDNGYLFMDPTADMLPFDKIPFAVQGADAFILTDKGAELVKIPVDSAEDNRTDGETNIYISNDGSMQAYVETKYSGQNAWLQRSIAKLTPSNQYNESLKQIWSMMIPNSILKEVKTTDYQNLDTPFAIDIIANVRDYGKKSGNLFMFKVPSYLEAFITMATAVERREAPLFILYPRSSEAKTIVKFPEQYTIKYMPQSASFETPVVFYKVEFESKDGEIIIAEKLTLKEREISEGKYSRFKNIIGKIRGIYNENIVLEQKQTGQKSN